jgi:hypothetical protein
MATWKDYRPILVERLNNKTETLEEILDSAYNAGICDGGSDWYAWGEYE